jgi:cytidylate kinase
MQLICVSQGSLSAGREFAEQLARKLDYRLLTREEVVDRATDEGIAIGRLEMAVMRRRPLDERLTQVKEHFQAFTTRCICERALGENLVYAGRSGHVLMPGVTHLLRIRVVTDMETRITAVMQRLRLGRDKAKQYIEQVEDDRERWARVLYNVDWKFAGIYDLIANLEQVSVGSATTALCGYAQLPEFQETPASRNALQNLLLASRARVAVARDSRTQTASVKVRANAGALSVTYLPRDAAVAGAIPEVLGKLSGVGDLRCSMASTNILWVQERFEASSPGFASLMQVAERWGAAVELLRVTPPEEEDAATPQAPPAAVSSPPPPGLRRAVDGGIEDDVAVPQSPAPGRDEESLRETYDLLTRRGIAGGIRSVEASPRQIGLSIDRTVPYSLVVVGDVFTGKGPAASQRLTRELAARLGDALKTPVVRQAELKAQYGPSAWQLVKLGAGGLGVAGLYVYVFTHQQQVLQFLTQEGTGGKALAAVGLLLFVPLIAYLYGNLAKWLLKLVRIE